MSELYFLFSLYISYFSFCAHCIYINFYAEFFYCFIFGVGQSTDGSYSRISVHVLLNN